MYSDRPATIYAHGELSNGLMIQVRHDPQGIVELPALPSIVVAVHIGSAAKLTCRRDGRRYQGTSVHGDIDVIPAHVSSN